MADLNLKQGEGAPLSLTYRDKTTKEPKDLTGASMCFIVRTQPDGNEVIRKEDHEFNKGLAADGIITFTLSTEETNIPQGLYYAQGRAYLTSTNSPLTDVFTIEIEESLYELESGTGLLDGKVTVTT